MHFLHKAAGCDPLDAMKVKMKFGHKMEFPYGPGPGVFESKRRRDNSLAGDPPPAEVITLHQHA